MRGLLDRIWAYGGGSNRGSGGGGVPYLSDINTRYYTVDGNSFDESQLKLDADILSAVGKIDSDSYLTRTESKFGHTDTSGYFEFRFYNPEPTNATANYGNLYLFEVSLSTSINKYFTINLGQGFVQLVFIKAVGGVQIIRNDTALTQGWHTVRLTSTGSAYTYIIDGVSDTTHVTSGADDGLWINSIYDGTNVITVGATRRSSTTGSTVFGGSFIDYIDYSGKNKWVFSTHTDYVYDVIGGKHLTWAGSNSHTAFSAYGGTYARDNGFSLWQKEGDPNIHVPYSSTGSALELVEGTSIPAGYTKTADYAGGTYNLANDKLAFRPVAQASGLVFDIYGDGDLNTNSGTRTFFNKSSSLKVGVTGKLRSFSIYYSHSANTTSYKLQIWRLATGTYTLIHNVEILALLGTASALITESLVTPLEVQQGDFIALCITNTSTDTVLRSKGVASTSASYEDSEKATGWDWSSSANAAIFSIQLFVDAPILACIGDSIMTGANTFAGSISNQTGTDTIENQIEHQLYTLNNAFTFINLGFTGNTLSDIYDDMSYAINSRPKFILMNGGINDIIISGETDNDVLLVDFNLIVDYLNDSGLHVIYMSLMPANGATNTQAAQIDALNALLETSMSTRDGIFVDLVPTVGLFRAGGDVGNLWDIQAAYTSDGTHLTVAGATAVAAKIYSDFSATYEIPDQSKVVNLDRSNATYGSAASRSASHYDATEPYGFHADELVDYTTLQTYFETDHKDKLFASIPINRLAEIINYATKKTGVDLATVKSYFGIT